MAIILVLALGLLILGAVENYLHTKRLKSIPIRIHVNGTRGKSTTTRLIAAGLREAGLRVVAKTTGTAARLILEDGSEVPLRRRGRASIREQLGVVYGASRRGAEALVVECMALSPEYQWVLEHRMLRSTIGVITNARADHLDQMGPTVRDVAESLARTVPEGGYLVTAERTYLDIFRREAQRNGTVLCAVDPSEVPDDEAGGFPYLAFKENLACALKVCELLGIPRDVALRGMRRARPDPGALRIFRCRPSLYFVNALAANDMDSTLLIWRRLEESGLFAGLPVIGVVNSRLDRPLRAIELASLVAGKCGGVMRLDRLVLLGHHVSLVRKVLARNGVDPKAVIRFGPGMTAEEMAERLRSLAGPRGAVIFAFGNVKGAGQALADYFERNGEAVSWQPKQSE